MTRSRSPRTRDKAPSTTRLREGAWLHSLVHAIFISHGPELANEVSWDGMNYSRQNSGGARGTVTFSKHGVVGAFFDEASSKSPFRGKGKYTLDAHLAGMPKPLLDVARKEALQYVLDELDGKAQPVVTSVFWSVEGTLAGAFPFEALLKHGAHLVAAELLPLEEALETWTRDDQLRSEQVDLVHAIIERRVARPEARCVINARERKALGLRVNRDTRSLLDGAGFELG